MFYQIKFYLKTKLPGSLIPSILGSVVSFDDFVVETFHSEDDLSRVNKTFTFDVLSTEFDVLSTEFDVLSTEFDVWST